MSCCKQCQSKFCGYGFLDFKLVLNIGELETLLAVNGRKIFTRRVIIECSAYIITETLQWLVPYIYYPIMSP